MTTPTPSRIEDIIPLYLAGKLPLESAIESASQTDPQSILSAVLKESRSLPRQIDTDPTTPTPDLPSPAQERLLHLVRKLQGHLGSERMGYNGLRRALDIGSLLFELDGTSAGGYKVEQRDILIDTETDTHTNEEDVFTSSSEAEPASASGSGSRPNTNSPSSQNTRQRRNSGAQKHLFNTLSFLSFLTKEGLLLHPGIGERIAIEMITETLEHPTVAPTGHELWFGGTSGKKRGDEVPITAISLWLIIMGEELYARARAQSKMGQTQTSYRSVKGKGRAVSLLDDDDEPAYGEQSVGGTDTGPWPELSAITIQEWETWTSRLQFLSMRQELEIHAREQAAEAAAVMRRV
ncbi:hypothetical protein BDW74DRAFT_131795 [Aspergillus multicolor]|uniref:uncharacterized protein n=1 Tax=Aspergillus multicolor TaxID=41759 RepID=UPI003CCCD58B